MAIPAAVHDLLSAMPDGSCVIEMVPDLGIDSEGRPAFFSHWAGDDGGVRAQIFRTDLDAYKERWVERHPGTRVEVLA